MAEPKLLDVLPEVIRSTGIPGSPLAALTTAADDMHAPVAAVLDHLDAVLDPFRAPPGFVRYLAGWVDLSWTGAADGDGETRSGAGVAVDRLRDVVAASADLAARRGTPAGLLRFLRLATGVEGFRVDVVPGAFHVRVTVPPAAAEHLDLVRHLVRTLRPAHVTSEVVLDGGDPAAPAVPAEEGVRVVPEVSGASGVEADGPASPELPPEPGRRGGAAAPRPVPPPPPPPPRPGSPTRTSWTTRLPPRTEP